MEQGRAPTVLSSVGATDGGCGGRASCDGEGVRDAASVLVGLGQLQVIEVDAQLRQRAFGCSIDTYIIVVLYFLLTFPSYIIDCIVYQGANACTNVSLPGKCCCWPC